MLILAPGLRTMARARSDPLLRNSLFVMATTVLNAAFGYAFWVAAARIYGVYQIGLAAGLISAATVAAALGSTGIGSTFVERLPERITSHAWSLTVSTGLFVGAAATAVVAAIVAVLLPMCGRDFQILRLNAPVLALFLVGAACWALAELLDDIFIAERRASRMLVRNTVVAATKVPLLLLPVLVAAPHTGGILLAWCVSAAFGNAVALVLLVPRCRPGFRPRVRRGLTEFASLRRSLASHHLIMLCAMLPTYLLPVIVVARLDAQSNAYFYVTWMLCGMIFMINTSVAGSMFAEASHRPADLRRVVRTSAVYIGLLLLLPALALALAGGAVLALFGAEYPERGWSLLLVLVVAAVPDAIVHLGITALRVRRRFLAAGTITVTMAVLVLGLAWILLPPLGIVGAGLAWLAAQCGGSLLIASVFIGQRIRAGRHRSAPRVEESAAPRYAQPSKVAS